MVEQPDRPLNVGSRCCGQRRTSRGDQTTLALGRRPLESNSMTQRVLHLTTVHRADDVRIFHKECRSLAEAGGYSVLLASPGDMPHHGTISHIPLVQPPPARIRRLPWSILRAAGLSAAVDVEIWHLHDPELVPIGIWLAGRGYRVIWDAHEDYSTQFVEGGGKSWIPQGLRGSARVATVSLLRRIDRVAAGVVAATATIASRYENARTVVVGNEARLDDYSGARPRPDSRQVLFLGQVTSSHMFGEVVDAVASIPGIELAVAGRAPRDGQLWAYGERTLGSRLRHLGWLDRTSLAIAMSVSRLGLVTYKPTRAYSDASGSSTKLFEFAAAGLPVAATPIPSSVQFVEASSSGYLAPGFSADDLRIALSEGFASEGDWHQKSRAAREWVQCHGSWAVSESRLLDLYRDVLSGDSGWGPPRSRR